MRISGVELGEGLKVMDETGGTISEEVRRDGRQEVWLQCGACVPMSWVSSRRR
jgi:hypothetical protein